MKLYVLLFGSPGSCGALLPRARLTPGAAHTGLSLRMEAACLMLIGLRGVEGFKSQGQGQGRARVHGQYSASLSWRTWGSGSVRTKNGGKGKTMATQRGKEALLQ